MAKAFAGIRVIDFTAVLAGPVAAMELALLGADVIKVEQPGVGDQVRSITRDQPWIEHGMSPAYIGANSGKRGITLDLKHARAGEVMARLIAGADVVIENFRAGVIDRLGFGYDWARGIRPDIVYCSISGYGQRGPRAGDAAYDGAVQAASGMMSLTGTPESGPLRTGMMPVDLATASTAAFAIAGALFRRERTGEGQHLDVAMYDCALSLMNPVVARQALAGVVPPRLGNLSPTQQATANTWPTGDGHISIAVIADHMIPALARVLGRPELADDPRYRTTAGRLANAETIHAEIGAILATEDTATWTERCAGEGVPAAPVNDLATALAEPQLAHRGVLMRLPAPAGIDGEVTAPGIGFVASDDSPGTDRPAPTLGQHTDEILAELGYDADAIAALRADGAV